MGARIHGAWRHTIAACGLLLGLAGVASAATVTVLNLDGPGEGFNDPTPVAPEGGNPETTIGAQRLFVFKWAADIWGRILPSNVEIRINAHFDPLTCDASSAVLGQTSAGSSHRNFANAPFTDTWYVQALANRLAGVDLNPGVNDMNITYNSNLCQPGCAFCWYYGVDGNEGAKIELLPVVLHEIGHGLGFATITVAGVQSGTPPGPHVYDRFLYDLDQDMHWNEMPTDAQRGASAVNCQRLVWDGACVAGSMDSYLGPKPVLRVTTPAAIAGDYEVGLGTFGPQTFNVTGNLVLVNDGSLPPLNSPFNGCEPFVNAAQVAGNIALVDRGTCPFTVKVKNAQDAGAIAVVVCDTMPGCPPLGMSGVDPTITIPVVRITTDDAASIKSQLAGGVNVNMLFDAALMAGTNEGKIMVYTPTVLATGSSVSHWDISATPNLLMEPFSTASISGSVDLTLNLYEDIGWFGATSVCGSTVGVDPESPATAVMLATPYPNPTSRGAAINFRIPRPEYVRLSIVDVSGRVIRSLHEGMLPPGAHMRHWDGTTESGSAASAGVYFLSLRTSEGRKTQRIALSR